MRLEVEESIIYRVVTDADPSPIQYVFTNRTNGAKVLWVQEGRIQWLSDETVVEMLMRPATIEPE